MLVAHLFRLGALIGGMVARLLSYHKLIDRLGRLFQSIPVDVLPSAPGWLMAVSSMLVRHVTHFLAAPIAVFGFAGSAALHRHGFVYRRLAHLEIAGAIFASCGLRVASALAFCLVYARTCGHSRTSSRFWHTTS